MVTICSSDFTYSFPAIRGVQAGREYYVTMCPMGVIPKLFCFDDQDIPPALRAQRALNRSRIPKITEYIVENPDSYVFSSLAASVDGQVRFKPMSENGVGAKVGTLTIPMGVRFLINDGQHRRAAIEAALQHRPSLENETISVVLFVDAGLAHSQQMFADLNRYAIRPTKSLGILYDHRDPMARLADRVVKAVPVFKDMTETARSTISNRSRKLFTLSSIYQSSRRLLNKKEGDSVREEEEKLVTEFWLEVTKHVPEWSQAMMGKVAPCELRRDYVHAHGIALQAIAIAGASLIASKPRTWKKDLSKLRKVNWSRQHAELWEGRAMIAGRLNKAENNVVLTANVLKNALGLSLSPTEGKIESLYEQGRNHKR